MFYSMGDREKLPKTTHLPWPVAKLEADPSLIFYYEWTGKDTKDCTVHGCIYGTVPISLSLVLSWLRHKSKSYLQLWWVNHHKGTRSFLGLSDSIQIMFWHFQDLRTYLEVTLTLIIPEFYIWLNKMSNSFKKFIKIIGNK